MYRKKNVVCRQSVYCYSSTSEQTHSNISGNLFRIPEGQAEIKNINHFLDIKHYIAKKTTTINHYSQ
jgi:hypothetical protein